MTIYLIFLLEALIQCGRPVPYSCSCLAVLSSPSCLSLGWWYRGWLLSPRMGPVWMGWKQPPSLHCQHSFPWAPHLRGSHHSWGDGHQGCEQEHHWHRQRPDGDLLIHTLTLRPWPRPGCPLEWCGHTGLCRRHEGPLGGSDTSNCQFH